MKSLLPLCLLPAALFAQVVAPPSTAVFDKDTVHEIRLTFAQSDYWAQLTSNYDTYPDNTPYIQASLVWGQYKFDSVGARFKGNSSYRGATTMKKPFHIKLNQYVKGQKIDSMASFGLSNAWSDPSFVREKPYYEMAAGLGLPAPRSNFAALYVNDQYLGLYVLDEIVNSDFLKNHFAKGDDGGNLYKGSDPGATLAYLGTDPVAYQTYFSKESNEDANDWTDLIELARIFDQTAIADLPAKLDSLIDVDSFLTALALDNATVNLDSYVGMAQNYYLYRRPSDHKWVWIPWDPSLAFGALAQNMTVQQMKDLSLEWVQTANTGVLGGGGGMGAAGGAATRPLASKLWQVPAYEKRYKQIYQNIIDTQMIPAKVIARMNALRDLIRPYVVADTQKLVTQAQFDAAMTSDATSAGAGNGAPGGGMMVNAGMNGAPGLQPFIEGRVIAIKSLLLGQTPLQITASPASVLVAQTVGTTTAGSQSIALSLNDATKAGTFTATASNPWIVLSAASGTLPTTLKLTFSSAGMTVGTYSGSVQIVTPATSNSPLSIPVTMSVVTSPALVASPASLTLISQATGAPGMGFPGGTTSTSQSVSVVSTAVASPFTITISDTTCANFFTVTPLSGTSPAVLTVTANPSTANSGTCTGRINVTSIGLASAVIPVTQTAAGNFPGGGGMQTSAITAIVNSASYANGPVAPGSLVTIFGSGLGPNMLASGAFSNGQLATTAGGVQVTFDGTAAPVLYARANQVGVAVPFEVTGKTQVAVQLTVNGTPAAPMQQSVGPAAPGIFTVASTGSGQAAVINQNGSINGANALAAKGSTVTIFISGAGQLTPPGKTGALGIATQAIAAPVRASIGGQDAVITYAGAAPGSLQGLYQINAIVPSASVSGNVPVQVTVGGVTSQSAVTMYVQ